MRDHFQKGKTRSQERRGRALKRWFGRGVLPRPLNHLRQKKPQTKYSCCLGFSFLMFDWLFPCKVLITFQMKYFCYKFMVFWVSWYYERQDLQDNILYIFIIFTLVQITRLWPWRRSGCKKKKEHHLPPSEKVTVMEDFFALIWPCTCKLWVSYWIVSLDVDESWQVGSFLSLWVES